MNLINIKRSIWAYVLVIGLLLTSARADDINALYAEIETLLLQPDGTSQLKERSSALSQELAATILEGDLEKTGKAAFLMRYADPAPNWDKAVSYLLTSEERAITSAGLSILDVHGILGDATEDKLTQLIADPSSTTILSGAARVAGRASLAEVIPLLRKELWSNDVERNIAAILGLIEFGPNASSLVPDLERKLRQLSEKQGSATEKENHLSYMPRADKTGALKDLLEKAIIQLTPVSSPAGIDSVENEEQQIETIASQTAEPSIEEPAEVVVAEPIEEDVEQSSNWWLWLLGILIVVGGLGLVLRRKS